MRSITLKIGTYDSDEKGKTMLIGNVANKRVKRNFWIYNLCILEEGSGSESGSGSASKWQVRSGSTSKRRRSTEMSCIYRYLYQSLEFLSFTSGNAGWYPYLWISVSSLAVWGRWRAPDQCTSSSPQVCKTKNLLHEKYRSAYQWPGSVTIWYGPGFGSVPLDYGSGSISCSFLQWLSRCQQKVAVVINLFACWRRDPDANK